MAQEISFDNMPEIVGELLLKVNLILESINANNIPNQKDEDKELMNADEAAVFLGCKKSSLYVYTSERKIKFSKSGKRLIFRRSDLLEWVSKGEVKTNKEILQDSEDAMIKANRRRLNN